MPRDSKTLTPAFQVEAEHVLLGLLLMLEDDDLLDADHGINYVWRFLDRVKYHMYEKKQEAR